MVIYTYDDELVAAGATRYLLATGKYFFDKNNGGFDTSYVSLNAMRREVPYAPEGGHALLDIESFSLTSDFDNAVKNLRRAAKWWNRLDPYRSIGFFRLIPQRNYWTPVRVRYSIETEQMNLAQWSANLHDLQTWQERNDRSSKALCKWVDFLCPCLYDFYQGQTQKWRTYAHTNIQEAMRVCDGNKILPIIMPNIHDGYGTPMPIDQWTGIVDVLANYHGIDGIFIYTSSSYEVHPEWREPLLKYISKPALNTEE